MAQKSHPSKAQMNTHLLLETIIAAASVMGLSSILAGLWVAKKAAGKVAGEAKDVIEDPAGKSTAANKILAYEGGMLGRMWLGI
jgi:hypothetical protein